jgi:hypothetical protein
MIHSSRRHTRTDRRSRAREQREIDLDISDDTLDSFDIDRRSALDFDLDRNVVIQFDDDLAIDDDLDFADVRQAIRLDGR